MLEYAGIGWKKLEYALICWNRLEHAVIGCNRHFGREGARSPKCQWKTEEENIL